MATKPRTRKRKAADAPASLAAPAAQEETALEAAVPSQALSSGNKNVSPFEGTLSVYAGGLLIAAALFPRSLKQLVLLGLGASFLYRGQTRHCGVYEAMGIDTNK